MTQRERRGLAIAMLVVFALVVLAAAAANGQTPTPAPIIPPTDEEVANMSWDEMVLTLKYARQAVATALDKAADQKDQLATAAKAEADALNATRTALVKLDAHDEEVKRLAEENEANKEASLKKDTEIANLHGTIFKLGAALTGLAALIIIYVGLRLFTKFPI